MSNVVYPDFTNKPIEIQVDVEEETPSNFNPLDDDDVYDVLVDNYLKMLDEPTTDAVISLFINNEGHCYTNVTGNIDINKTCKILDNFKKYLQGQVQ